MKFLLDESAELRLAHQLNRLDYDVTVIGRDHPRSLKDPQVLEIANREGRIVITNDKDFGEMVFREGFDHQGVIFFRMKDESTVTKIARLYAVLEVYKDIPDSSRAFITVTDTRIRVR